MHLLRGIAACALALLPLLPACTCSSPTPTPGAAASASAQPSARASSSAAARGSAEMSTGDPDVKPVYPMLTGPPHPLAQKLCDALYDIPNRRRAECCGHKPAQGFESECLRNLTGALTSNAVTIDEAAIGRCAEAITADLQGCDWVAPFPFTPSTPAACLGLIKGTRKVGAVCRSTLECEGNLNCAGVGPTTAGRCTVPREAGPCGPQTDALVGYTRQNDTEKTHPQCTGYCDRRRCVPLLKEGDACTSSDACGAGFHCGDGKCKKGEAGKAGERCLGLRCDPGLRCDQGTCVAARKENEACERNEQCRGFCVKKPGDGADAGKNVCAARCEMTLPTPTALGSGKSLGSLLKPPPRAPAK